MLYTCNMSEASKVMVLQYYEIFFVCLFVSYTQNMSS